MNKITVVFIFGLNFVFNQVCGQTFEEQFNDLVSKKDTLGQQQLLERWEKVDSNDPELYVAYFNYFATKSMKEIITLGQNPKGNNVLEIKDNDSSKKEPVAYMYGDTYYDHEIARKGFNYIDKGLDKHPNRLDMRFGKIYLLGQIEDYENFTKEIITAISYSDVNKNKWTWTDSKPLEDPQKFMLSTIQSYQLQLYNTGNDDLLDNMKRIAEAVLKFYPDHIESLSNIAIVFILRKQYDKALEQLSKAEKLNPNDYIVLSNIAEAFKLKGDTKNAIKYYELTIKHGDEQAINFAKGQIEKLKKK
jgi:tetratricopeptide (TPR) repeat protein